LLALKHQKNLNKIVDRHDFEVNASYALHMALEKSSNKEVIQMATEISKDYMRAKSKKFKQMSTSEKKRAGLPVDIGDGSSRPSIIRIGKKKTKEEISGS
jgi:replicative DNA helicase